MATSTLKFAAADCNKFVFSDKKKAQTAGRPDNVFITYGNRYMLFQLNGLRVPFDKEASEDGSYTFTASLDKSNAKHAAYIAKAREFDEVCRTHLKRNSFALLKKKEVDDGFLSATFRPFLRIKCDEQTDEELYHNLKIKIPVDYKAGDGSLTTVFLDEHGAPVGLDHLVQYSNVDVIVRPQKMFFGTKVGTTWVAHTIRIRQPEGMSIAGGNLFNDSDDGPRPTLCLSRLRPRRRPSPSPLKTTPTRLPRRRTPPRPPSRIARHG